MNAMKKILLILALFVLTVDTRAQVPAPGPKQNVPILISNGTAHLGTGEIIENAAIGFENGVITFVGTASDQFPNKESYKKIDVKGKHLYPGFILPNSILGLVEVNPIRATRDYRETGSLNPNVRSAIAYNTDSEIIPTLRYNGILTAQVIPVGGLISGTSSIMQLDAWNWEDALIKEDDGIHLFWPRKLTFQGTAKPEDVAKANEKYELNIQSLHNIFQAAKSYSQVQTEKANLKLEAMKGLFDGSQQLFIRVDKAKDIVRSIEFAKEYLVKNVVLVGATEALVVKDYIKDNDIPIILTNVNKILGTTDASVDAVLKMPFMLNKEEILFCLGYGLASHVVRNLPFLAGTSVAYGMNKEEALKTITLNTAKILKIDDQLGSIEVGKHATMFVSEGDALDMRTNKLTMAFIQGRKVTLEAMQQELYQKYKAKYGQ
jgi:imidazolonepropionase-like amidohydrolase